MSFDDIERPNTRSIHDLRSIVDHISGYRYCLDVVRTPTMHLARAAASVPTGAG